MDRCTVSLVETIPVGMNYSDNAPRHEATYDSWMDLIGMAQDTIEIASLYWTMKREDVFPDDSAKEVSGTVGRRDEFLYLPLQSRRRRRRDVVAEKSGFATASWDADGPLVIHIYMCDVYIRLTKINTPQGEQVFQSLLEAGRDRYIKLKIVQNMPSRLSPSTDTVILAKKANAQVICLLRYHGGIDMTMDAFPALVAARSRCAILAIDFLRLIDDEILSP